MKQLKNLGHELSIISHKTLYPIIGDKVNFHQAALQWLFEFKRSPFPCAVMAQGYFI